MKFFSEFFFVCLPHFHDLRVYEILMISFPTPVLCLFPFLSLPLPLTSLLCLQLDAAEESKAEEAAPGDAAEANKSKDD